MTNAETLLAQVEAQGFDRSRDAPIHKHITVTAEDGATLERDIVVTRAEDIAPRTEVIPC